MILSRPETGRAFEQLIAALEAETCDLNELGARVARESEPKKGAAILKLAGERARFRDHISALHAEWKKIEPDRLAPITSRDPTLPPPGTIMAATATKPAGPLLTIGEAARKVGVTPKQIRDWIFAGHLPAQQGPSGRWKVSGPGLIECYRKFTRKA